MPDETAPEPWRVILEFYHICVRARNAFDLYHNLFESDRRNLHQCFSVAPLFFGDINAILIESIVLEWCKITDPATTGKNTNLTTNYIVEKLPWTPAVRAELAHFNSLLMAFRKKVEPARSKRIVHTDYEAQIGHLPNLGEYTPGEDFAFFANLQSFYDIAHKTVSPDEPPRPHALGMSRDIHNLFRALTKAKLYDQCNECTEESRAIRVLDHEGIK
jgi:hypothetical protein